MRWGRQTNAKTDVVVTAEREVAEAIRTARAVPTVVERTAAQDATCAAFWAARVNHRTTGAFFIFGLVKPIRAPFPDIPDHVGATVGRIAA